MSRICTWLGVCLFLLASFAGGEVMAMQWGWSPISVKDHGAHGDGQTVDTDAIQRAIDTCHAKDARAVYFPAGRYLTGTLHLRSRVKLELAAGATIVGVQDLEAYSGFEAETWGKTRWNRGLLVGEDVHDVEIAGQGTIDGARVFDPQGEEQMRGPHTILLADCVAVTIRDVTIRDSANYALLFYGSENVAISDVTFEGGWDGVHFRGKPDAWNLNVRIEGCKFFTGDDCIAGHYVEDAVVRDCVLNSSCNGVRVIGPARGMTFERCEFFGPGVFEHRTSKDLHRRNMLSGFIIQPSAWTPTPGPLEDVTIRDVTMRNVACPLHVSIRKDNSGDRLLCERLKARGVYGQAISVESWADQPFGEVTLRDIDVAYTPDAVVDPRLKEKPQLESPIRQPGAGVFARKLPAWGLYGRNLDTLHLERTHFANWDLEDTRSVLLTSNIVKFLTKLSGCGGVKLLERSVLCLE